jgi:hypothetical protein
LFWASKRLFIGLEKKQAIRHSFLHVGRIGQTILELVRPFFKTSRVSENFMGTD